MEQRKSYLDIAKGIGIIFVVWGHANGPFSSYIYQFHMPLFFLISGLLFNKNDSIENYVIKKFKSLYIPYVFWNTVVYFFEYEIKTFLEGRQYNLESYLNVVFQIEAGANKAFLLGATWFIASLFWISIANKIVYEIIRKHNRNDFWLLIISALFAALGFVNTFPYFISRSLICGFFYSSGVVFKSYLEKRKESKYSYAIAICSFFCFVIIGKSNSVNMGANIYTNKILFIIGAYCAIGFFMFFSYYLDKYTSFFKKVLSFIGKNSMPIVIWQFVAFVPVTFLQANLSGKSIHESLVLAFSQHAFDTSGWYWLIYCSFGIMLPLGVHIMIKKTRVYDLLKRVYLVR